MNYHVLLLLLLLPSSLFAADRVDPSTMEGKVLCGYQGWFTTPEDGSNHGWFHYSKGGKFEPGASNIEFWPDMSELGDDEKFATKFKHADGSTAHVFSSQNKKTVVRHFQWMKDYAIDGVFVQRFAVQVFGRDGRRACDNVLAHCRAGAKEHGRVYAVMYDLSGMQQGQMSRVIEDWKRLVDDEILKDETYLHDGGKPVVAVWGIGFNDGRRYTLAECRELITFLKEDPKYGGCTVMLGIPTGWRNQDRDCVKDETFHTVIQQADILSPWTVGRYGTPREATQHAARDWQADIKWCQERKLKYLPVAFPGFSWHNMRPQAKFDQIPRLKGEFLWSQYVGAKEAGATMIYQAMFDEMDEGTAIFKCTNDPPAGETRFLTYEVLPTDHYLWLTGMGGKLLRSEIEKEMPVRMTNVK